MVDRPAQDRRNNPETQVADYGGGPRAAPDAGGGDRSEAPSKASAADALPHVTLPKGGGAIRGIGEKLKVNPATGTCSLSIPLPLSPGRSGFTPQLGLSYDSGAGNGPFGFGWSLTAPAVVRKTDKGLPQYCDGDESDVFILSGAEDLVPVLDASGQRLVLPPRKVNGTTYTVNLYRPRIEGLFSRIERWVAGDTGLSYWRTISKDNITSLYGFDPRSRIVDAQDPLKIFAYQICRSWNDKGDAAFYDYALEDGAGVDRSAAHEANRTEAVRGVKTYLTTVQYGNPTPYFADWSAEGQAPWPDQWMFTLALDYGDHASAAPPPARDQPWPVRPDPFSTYRAGFEVRTYRRVQRLLFFNNFSQEPSAGADVLVRSIDLTYSDQVSPADPRNPIYTFLTSVTQTGHRLAGAGYASASLPPLEFAYSQPLINPEVLSLDRDSLANLPEGLDGDRFRWVDLDGEGLSGILAEAQGGWFYKRNLSADNCIDPGDGVLAARARFGPVESIASLPSRSNFAAPQQLLNLGGDGRLDLVAFAEPDAGFYKRAADATFEPFRRFTGLPQVDWSDPNLKFIDLTGDGLADVLITEDGLFTLYASLGEAGFDAARQVRTPWDEEKGPKVVLSDGTQTIFIADMSGDGLNDIVRVRNGETCYWPNQGYGLFGAKVTMDRAPRFDNEERFDPRRIRLADIDGSGAADIIYIGGGGVRAWFNQSGNAWSAPNPIAVFPTTDLLSSVQAFDLLGVGTACLVWSSPLPGAGAAPLVYVDLMGGVKPHLMVMMCNNLGAETRVAYAPSTRFYLSDQAAGRPWITRLPFPVQVVERVEVVDWIGRNRAVTRYAYHHGYFDGFEREFRGFGMVEQWDTDQFRADTALADGDFVNWDQQSWSPPMLTRTWFHTGAFVEAGVVSRQYAHEYWVEPALRAPGRAAAAAAMTLPDTILPSGLSPFELQEAYRALKGQTLRIETYGEDGSAAADNPYTVVEQTFTIEAVQPMGGDRHAVFFLHPREVVTFNYERAGDDPRVTHEFTLETDLYGDVKRSVQVGYPRRAGYPAPEPAQPAATQAMLAYDQGRLHVLATSATYTDPLDDPLAAPDVYRAPLTATKDISEFTGIVPSVKGAGVTDLFTFQEMDSAWKGAWIDIAYEAVPAPDIDGAGSPPAAPTRRMVKQSRTFYRADDLTGLLPPRRMGSLGLPGDTYQAALTQGQLNAVFGPLVDATILAAGGYVQLAGETGWWTPSGRLYYSPGDADTPAQELAAAKAHFFRPRRAVDALGGITRVDYDAYDLLPVAATDPVGNATGAANDYRVLAPATVTDANGNQTAIAFDALGLVAGTAVMGKTAQALGDLLTGFVADLDDATLQAHLANPLIDPGSVLGLASTRIIRDLTAYLRTRGDAQPTPPTIYMLARETHVSDLTPGQTTRFQHRFTYSDGFNREIQHKAQAADGALVSGGPVLSPRWVGSGWTIFNNKGKPVRIYEPFFTATSGFEFAAVTGVSKVVFYDPAGRAAAQLNPDDSWTKTVFGAWRTETWDADDTVLISDPRTDADVGERFTRLLGPAPGAFQSWHDQRIGGTFGATAEIRVGEQNAAQKTETHAATPRVEHLDALGRACLAIHDNGAGRRYPTRIAFDVEAKPLAVIDALGRRVVESCLRVAQGGGGFQYVAGIDMTGAAIYDNKMDGGARRGLVNVAGLPIRKWDARNNAFRTRYDPARRPTHDYVSIDGAAEILCRRTIYGEGLAAANLCGKLVRMYDEAGVAVTEAADFKGNPVSTTRQLAVDYHQSVNWKPLENLTAAADLDAAAAPMLSVDDLYRSAAIFDALNRPTQQITPHSAAMKPNVVQPTYDASGLTAKIDLWLQRAGPPLGLLDPATADQQPVAGLAYNARGQRSLMTLGNGSTTAYIYDPQTFRLTRLTTTRPGSFPADQQLVQDIGYFYDPSGDVTRIRDDADTQNVIYFRNQRVEPSCDYSYDPLHQLIAASGREHLGQTGGGLSAPQQIGDDDSFRTGSLQPGDGDAMGTYTESYGYDPVGDLLSVTHQTGSGNWTRRYAYAEPSQIDPAQTCGRLSATSLPGDAAAGPFSAAYDHDKHGNMVRMPHLPALTWNEQDRLRSTTRQIVKGATPETTFYAYDVAGRRVRKTTDRQAPLHQYGTRKAERIYLAGVEIYREMEADGVTVSLQRETLRVEAGDQAIALTEIRTVNLVGDPAPAQLIRYQYANHLGSAVLELDDQARILSYEEYFPFGATAYQATANQTNTPKRYRYTGKERDEESDLYYHGVRYYAPWIGRWTSVDPAGLGDGVNLYRYVANNPVRLNDPTGAEGKDQTGKDKANKPAEENTFLSGDDFPISTAKPPTEAEVIKAKRAEVTDELLRLNDLVTKNSAKIPELLRQEFIKMLRKDLYDDTVILTNLEANFKKPPRDEDPSLAVDVQGLATANFVKGPKGKGVAAFSSFDPSVAFIWKNVQVKLVDKPWGVIAVFHEPSGVVGGSIHSADPTAARTTDAHFQPAVQIDLVDFVFKYLGKERVEAKLTINAQADVNKGAKGWTAHGQTSIQPSIEAKAGPRVGVIVQGSIPVLPLNDHPLPSVSFGLIYHFP